MKKLLFIFLITFPFVMTAQMTYVPDDNFEQALIDLGYDYGPLNDSVPTKNIDKVKILEVNGKNIADLSGIEDFRALDSLDCSRNRIITLNVSQNTDLKSLYCSYNNLNNLVISQTKELKLLSCSFNALPNLDISQSPNIVSLRCDFNKLNSLDLSKNNVLEILDVRTNPPLKCIQVIDSSIAANNTGWLKDGSARYSENCSYDVWFRNTYIPDDSFEEKLIQLGYDFKPLNDSVPTRSIDTITYFNISGWSLLSDLTGIEDFKSLKVLDCSSTKIRNLDLSHNPELEELYCSDNKLSSFDGSKNHSLVTLSCHSNQIISIDLSQNPVLEKLYCSNNKLTSLDVSKIYSLKSLVCNDNQLTNLDISENHVLEDLNCTNNQMSSLDISKNYTLNKLTCLNNNLTSLDIRNNFNLVWLDCSMNQLKSLELSNNTALKVLSCYANHLTYLELSNNTSLEDLSCSSNELISLDVSNNHLLKSLYCNMNLLTSLDFSKNPELGTLSCPFNKLIHIDVTHNPVLGLLWCSSNQLESLNINNNPALIELDAINNPNLNCIQVIDSSKAATNGHWHKDDWAIYSEDCSTVGVNENKIELSDISVNPNPASDYIEINLGRWTPSVRWSPSDLTIYNSLGECVMNIGAEQAMPLQRINISSLPPGLYNCIISTPKFMESVKFIIVR